MRIVRFLVFMVVIDAATHYYLWLRLVDNPALPAPWFALATGLIVTLGVAIPASLLFGRRAGAAAAVTQWLGALFMLVIVNAALDLVSLAVTIDPRVKAVIALAAAAVLVAYSVWS